VREDQFHTRGRRLGVLGIVVVKREEVLEKPGAVNVRDD
jgi:hypothetical protein